MALPTRPLAIKDACGVSRSIAREVDGNVTGNKSLHTLGVTAGFTSLGTCMSEFENYSSSSVATTSIFASVGSDFSTISCKCACVIYSPALESPNTWGVCLCWIAETYNDGEYGDAKTSVAVVCNGVGKMSCTVCSLGGNPDKICNGKYYLTPIDYDDVVCLKVCTCTNAGGGYGYAWGEINMYCSTSSNVTIGSPSNVCAVSEDA